VCHVTSLAGVVDEGRGDRGAGESPVLFSFRLAGSLLVSDLEKQALLETDSVEERLRLATHGDFSCELI
jgi:hypothetical protein